MPIRVRILLLALLTVVSVGGALFMQYRTINAEVEALERRTQVFAEVRLTSRAIHALQKERGLSASFLANTDAEHLSKLNLQRQKTDDILSLFNQPRHASLRTSSWLKMFQADLVIGREKIDSKTTNWQVVRSLYTDAITHALDTITLEILGGERVVQGRSVMAISSLALARERLGLIRATIARSYSQHEGVRTDLNEIVRDYGAFVEYQRLFTRDLSGAHRAVILTKVYTDVYDAVIHRIEAALGFLDGHSKHHPLNTWWDEATLVIDTMKTVEDQIFDVLSKQYAVRIETKRAELHNYTLGALTLASLVVLLTVLTMMRMLKAMGVLLKTLRQVISFQDFKARIPSGSSTDEFGQIGLSVNDLLSYTDTLIKEKDFLANTDLLTGVLNRRSFLDVANKEFDRVRRYGGTLGLAVCDIDHFKAVNDTHGHDVGDLVLKRFSAIMLSQLRQSDHFGRWGGEEFVVLVPQAETTKLLALTEKLRISIQAADFPEIEPITCSIGVAEMYTDDTFDTLFKRADKALFSAKNNGRNRVVMAENKPIR